ncbi:MAG: cation-translocating P-type ATPase, partial [Citricoccus sp.]|nr:cation-translocating P-type ATPase [Citricoccus sp. WCRC_4]
MAQDAEPHPVDTAPPAAGRDWTRTAAEDVVRHLDTDPDQGLSAAEASVRLGAYGPNELVAAPPEPGWRRLLRQFTDPLIYLLLTAVAVSLLVWMVEGAVGMPVDAVVIFVIVVFNAILGYVQEARAADAVAALQDLTAVTVSTVRGGRTERIPATELVPGDLLVLAEGDSVGADARLLSASSLQVAEASLTGESVPVTKSTAVLDAAVPLGDRVNMVFKG